MSRKTAFQSAIFGVVASLGGSHLTREARQRTAAKFADVVFDVGYTHLSRPSEICGRHIRAFVESRKRQGIGVRTLQNELSHIRKILRAVGKHALADAHGLRNPALGVSGGSRLGAKSAMSDEDYLAITARAIRQGRPGMASLLSLERALGLRGNEAIHARPDTLARWLRELSEEGRITVLAGTKGGRSRTVRVLDTTVAIASVSTALSVCATQGGYLVVRANGRPAGGLQQARAIYHSWASRTGIQPHAARYAFARKQLDGYLSRGYSAREALMSVSQDLGHGDGRGRWIKCVYMR